MLGSPVDIAIIGVVVLVVFGPKKVPELGKALGQGIGNFKRALSDVSDDVKAGINESEKKDAAHAPSAPAATPAAGEPQAQAPADEKAVTS
ncbi:MAG TPA: twin-arginine translocase TatA/TatE family subunit [Oculatellaceae cyanobacterium]|jgi:sec-independent protein translocase protein TatA